MATKRHTADPGTTGRLRVGTRIKHSAGFLASHFWCIAEVPV
jgi:hypothetical protein